jgi:hypothetical protein
MAAALRGDLHARLWIHLPRLPFLPRLVGEATDRRGGCVDGRAEKMETRLRGPVVPLSQTSLQPDISSHCNTVVSTVSTIFLALHFHLEEKSLEWSKYDI